MEPKWVPLLRGCLPSMIDRFQRPVESSRTVNNPTDPDLLALLQTFDWLVNLARTRLIDGHVKFGLRYLERDCQRDLSEEGADGLNYQVMGIHRALLAMRRAERPPGDTCICCGHPIRDVSETLLTAALATWETEARTHGGDDCPQEGDEEDIG